MNDKALKMLEVLMVIGKVLFHHAPKENNHGTLNQESWVFGLKLTPSIFQTYSFSILCCLLLIW
jgi:hypothetical protein